MASARVPRHAALRDPWPEPPFPVAPRARDVLRRLWAAGHAGWLVGGGVRDALLGRPSHDWDVATDARPERLLELFPGATSENRFGTVVADGVEITTFRRDHRYADHRRPESVTFTDDLAEDLARRDFTVNAIAWGLGAGASRTLAGGFEDPHGGRADLAAGILRTVGDPHARFDEDALRILRAARIASVVGLRIDGPTLAAMAAHAGAVRWVSVERTGQEIRRLLAATVPSPGLRTLQTTGVLPHVLPEVAAQLGVPQAKLPGHDLLDHALLTLDAAARLAPTNERLRLAALLHDIGKPGTLSAGHFPGHEQEGARLARVVLGRLGLSAREAREVERLIEEHMFGYERSWSDAAVRRFMRRVGDDLVDDLLRLREADDAGSGRPLDPALAELRARIVAQREAGVALSLRDLAIDGHDLQRELGMAPSPAVGALLRDLLELVVADPARNVRGALLDEARSRLASADGQAHGTSAPEGLG